MLPVFTSQIPHGITMCVIHKLGSVFGCSLCQFHVFLKPFAIQETGDKAAVVFFLWIFIYLAFCRGGLLCLDGKTKCFDKNADGYVRADAINVIFLQRARDAHR